MLALIAGRGDLPAVLANARQVLVCALDHSLPDKVDPDHLFRVERLGPFLKWLKKQGVTQICLCGGIDRPQISPWKMDFSTLMLLPKVRRAQKRGDDGALRIVIGIFEQAGFEVLAAHEVLPDLLPKTGVPTMVGPSEESERLAQIGDETSLVQGREDLGQSCVIQRNAKVVREDDAGTDAMLAGLGPDARSGVMYKAPKPGQDRRADLPVIGPGTAEGAARAGLAGIIIEANGVMVLNYDETLRRLDAEGLFLWLRERPE
ncbi:MAG: UDP-2,3-diacylglucosamine diphosphatase LpxI [Pelagimonas sp.]